MAGKATTTGGLRLGTSEVLRSFRHLPAGTKPKDITPCIDRLEEERRRKSKRSTIFLERTVSKATLGKLLRDWAKRTWAFPSAWIPPLN